MNEMEMTDTETYTGNLRRNNTETNTGTDKESNTQTDTSIDTGWKHLVSKTKNQPFVFE